jgi:plastocyanin
MKIRILISVLVCLSLLISWSQHGSAGGMATVHLDEAPSDVRVGVPVSIGFKVMQHDVTPVNVDEAMVAATHRTSGESLQVKATQTGAIGHYVAEVTFPTAGSWKWSITPAPFAGTSFESIEVAAPGQEPATWDAELLSGTCLAPETLVASIGDILALSPNSPVQVIPANLDIAAGDLRATPHSLHLKSPEGTIACAEMTGTIHEGSLVVAIDAVGNSGTSGIATVGDAGGGIVLTLYLSTVSASADDDSRAQSVVVEITGGEGSWSYTPARVDASPGDTVTWVNKTETSHTVTGSSTLYEDSGPILPGESWSQTFLEPGTFDYFCSPHPFMTGSITIE